MTRYRQFCALARAAEIIGERWTLLVVRELLLGARRFADLERGLHGISPALLTQRLAHMEEAGLIQRSLLPPPVSAHAYELTAHGHALRPAVLELIRWGGRFLFPPHRGEVFEPEWMRLALEACAPSGPTPECAVGLRVRRGRQHAEMRVSGGPQGTRISGDDAPVAATISASVETIFALASGGMSVEEAVRDGRAEITGSLAVLAEFPNLFDMQGLTGEKIQSASVKRRDRKAAGSGRVRRSRSHSNKP